MTFMPTQYTPFSEPCNTLRGIHRLVVMCANAYMRIDDLRRANLLAYCRRECGGNQADLARRANRKPNQISDMLAGRKSFGEKVAREIEANLGLQPGAFDRPESRNADEAHTNVEPGPRMRGMVPVISSVRAGSWGEAADPYAVGDAEDWIPCPVKSYSKHTYALRVKGDSMTSPYGKSYPDGCIIYVDPQQNGCAPGDRVIAKLPGQDEVTFKQLASDGARNYLKPLNPHHPPIFGEFKVIGRVIGKYEPE